MGKGNRERAKRRDTKRLRDEETATLVPIPAYCANGHVFASDVFITPHAEGVEIRGDVLLDAGRCPKCGAPARIPDEYMSFEDIARAAIISAPEADKQRLRGLLEQVQGETSGEVVADALIRQDSRWASLAEFLRPKTGAEIIGYLAFLLAIVLLFL